MSIIFLGKKRNIALEKLLIVEESKLLLKYLLPKLKNINKLEIITISNMQELNELHDNATFSLAVIDNESEMNKSDTSKLKNILQNNDTPTIMLTNDFHYKSNNKNVIDFIIKDSLFSIEYIVKLVTRVLNNKKTNILIVDDSPSMIKTIQTLLEKHLYKIFTTKNPLEALSLVQKLNIDIVISDYNMPKMNGIELLRELRANTELEELSIVGVSTEDENAKKFLKYGANEFINKIFLEIELVHRINSVASRHENIKKLKDFANLDYLTQVSNRKSFFEKAKKIYIKAQKQDKHLALAMIDIDNFKTINDTYGHPVGDIVIKDLANTLQDNTKGRDIVARFGGEEFCVLLQDIPAEDSEKFFTKICEKIADNIVKIDSENYINYTVSIGITHKKFSSLDAMISQSDALLYDAKRAGKNMCIFDGELELI